MKKFLTIITITAMVMIAGCVDLDDIYRRLDKQAKELADQGKELATMKALIDAINKKISVVSYTELADKNGYELTMSDGSKITIKHGAKGEQGQKGEQGVQGPKGDQGTPGKDGDANLTITEAGDVVIIVYKGITYNLPKKIISKMILTTAKNVGMAINLSIDAAEADRPDVWIDLNNNALKDEGEAVTKFGSHEPYIMGAQTITVYGKVKTLNCHSNQLTFLDVSNNTALEFLACHSNQLISLNVGKNIALGYLCCYQNKISGSNMTELVNSLPDRKGLTPGVFMVFYTGGEEQNIINAAQAATAKSKNWNIYNSSGIPYTPGS